MKRPNVQSLLRGYSYIFNNVEYANIFSLSFATSFLSAMLIPVFPLWVAKDIKVPLPSMFFLFAILGVCGAILNAVVGMVSDRIGRRKIFIEVALVLAAFRGLMYSFFPYVFIIIIMSSLTQISMGALPFAALNKKIEQKRHKRLKGLITASVRTSVSLGYVLGPFVGILLIINISFKMFFLIYGLAYFILFLIVKFNVLNMLYPRTNQVSNLSKPDELDKAKSCTQDVIIAPERKTIVPKPNKSNILAIIFSVASVIFLFAGNLTCNSLLTIYVDETFSRLAIAIVFGVGPVLEVFVFPLVGRLNDKFGVVKMVFIGAVSEIIYFALLAYVHNVYLIVLVQGFGTFYIAVLFSGAMMYIQNQIKQSIGFSSSVYFSAISIAKVIGNTLLGAMFIKYSYKECFLVLAFMTFIGLLFLICNELFIKKRGTDFRLKALLS